MFNVDVFVQRKMAAIKVMPLSLTSLIKIIVFVYALRLTSSQTKHRLLHEATSKGYNCIYCVVEEKPGAIQ